MNKTSANIVFPMPIPPQSLFFKTSEIDEKKKRSKESRIIVHIGPVRYQLFLLRHQELFWVLSYVKVGFTSLVNDYCNETIKLKNIWYCSRKTEALIS